MSRYKVPSISGQHDVVVGWLRTYFAQVAASLDCDDHELLLWLGTFSAELRSIAELERVIREYARLPMDVRERLERDQNAVRL